MADQKITFDGDSTGLVGALNRVSAALEKNKDKARQVGQEIDKQKGASATVNNEIEQTFRGLGKSVLVTAALAKTMQAVADASKLAREHAAKIGEEKGGESIRVALAMRKTGATPEQVQSVTGMIGEGTTTASETTSFIEAIAKKRGRRGPFEKLQASVRAFQSGAFTQEELLERRTAPTAQEVAARVASLPDDARKELEIRRQLRDQEAVNRGLAANRPATRFVANEIERRKLENSAIQTGMEAVKSVPGIGPLAGEGEADVIEAQERRQRDLGGERTTMEFDPSREGKPRLKTMWEYVPEIKLDADTMMRLVVPPRPTIIGGSKE